MSNAGAGERAAILEPVGTGFRFCVQYRPAPANVLRGAVVYVHPFAEEMNRSRRMAALAAGAMARAGWAVTQCDLLGCGDSSGDFGDATWDDWISDLQRAVARARCEAGAGRLWLWATRGGALLLPALLETCPDADLLLWQPVASGQLALTQFLRLSAASTMVGGEGASVKELRATLADGAAVEVAGYTVGPRLARGLDGARLIELPASFRGRVRWLEVVGEGDALSPVALSTSDAWKQRGIDVHSETVAGPPFWQTIEIAECPPLIDRTLSALLT